MAEIVLNDGVAAFQAVCGSVQRQVAGKTSAANSQDPAVPCRRHAIDGSDPGARHRGDHDARLTVGWQPARAIGGDLCRGHDRGIREGGPGEQTAARILRDGISAAGEQRGHHQANHQRALPHTSLRCRGL
jgi:hypothetical protein